MSNQEKKPKVLTKKHIARLERERRQVTIVRTVAIAMIIIVAGLIGYGILDVNYLQLQKPAVEVNGEKISIKQFQERVQLQRANLVNIYQQYQFYQQTFGMDMSQQIQQISYYLQSPEAVGQLVIDQLIDEALIRQEAEKRGITVSDEEVEKAIQEAYNFFPNGTPTPTITPTPFEYPTLTSEQLTLYPHTPTPTTAPTFTPEPTSTPDPAATATPTPSGRPTPTLVPEDIPPTATPYTLEGFQTQYTDTVDRFKSYGVSEATLRDVYRNNILRQKLQDAIAADLPTSEEQVWARHILVDTESEAVAIVQLLKNGSDFARLAKEFSKDTGSGAQGGDLGWFGRGVMVPEFENAAFSQPIGEIGEPVKTQFGYHIIQVLDRRELPLTPSQLENNRQKAFTDWLDAAKAAAQITTYDTWRQHIPPMPDFQPIPQ
ncbi:MAG: peptidylprolyl isomerase [Chloroflexota bacterium]